MTTIPSNFRWSLLVNNSLNSITPTNLFKTVQNTPILTCRGTLCSCCPYQTTNANVFSCSDAHISDSAEAYSYILNNHPELLI